MVCHQPPVKPIYSHIHPYFVSSTPHMRTCPSVPGQRVYCPPSPLLPTCSGSVPGAILPIDGHVFCNTSRCHLSTHVPASPCPHYCTPTVFSLSASSLPLPSCTPHSSKPCLRQEAFDLPLSRWSSREPVHGVPCPTCVGSRAAAECEGRG